MGENSKIEWCDHTFNPWVGCTKVSAGCTNCYAEANADKRLHFAKWGPNGTRVLTSEAYWRKPLRWNEARKRYLDCINDPKYLESQAYADGFRFIDPGRRVFCGSMCDIFEHRIDHDRFDLNGWRSRLWDLILATPNLDWLLLTKRPENVLAMTHGAWCKPVKGHVSQNEGDGRRWCFPKNVWIGTTVEDQAAADKRIPELLKIPAAVRFLSCEPLLGPIDLCNIAVPEDCDRLRKPWHAEGSTFNCLTTHCDDQHYHQPPAAINGIIVGGESGPKARPMHPDWARSLRDQCQAFGAAFFFKQWGEWLPPDQDGAIVDGHQILNSSNLPERIGKKRAGRLLDGREWNELPEART